MMISRWSGWITTGAVMAALAVALGAIAAHGIDHYLAERYAGQTKELVGEPMPTARKYLDDFKTASRYQMAHAMGLIVIGLLASVRPSRLLSAAAWCHLLGMVMFCGSLYWLSLTAHSMSSSARHGFGLTAACGGTTLIIGWCLLAAAVCPCRKPAAAESDSTTT